MNKINKKSFNCSPLLTRQNLSNLYSPGVADQCLAIQQNPTKVLEYTNIDNKVYLLSDGSAVLGIGNQGIKVVKPVLESKAMIMQSLAGIDASDIACSREHLLNVASAIAENASIIFLEDIAAPYCFQLQEELSQKLNIPVFHDDQQGTAIVICAAIQKYYKYFLGLNIVIIGAGASGQFTGYLLKKLGANIIMFDSKGCLHKNRSVDHYKARFLTENYSLEDALENADVLLGLSIKNSIDYRILKNMPHNKLILVLANPDPDLDIHELQRLRPDLTICTGRSDLPNQVNNITCFPFLIRAVLDLKLQINDTLLFDSIDALTSIESQEILPDIFDWKLQFGFPSYLVQKYNPTANLDQYKWSLLSRLLHISINTKKVFPTVLPKRNLKIANKYIYFSHLGPIITHIKQDLSYHWISYFNEQVVDGSDLGLLYSCF